MRSLERVGKSINGKSKNDCRCIQLLKCNQNKCIKSLLFKVDDQFVLVLVRGDHEVNDIKLKNLFNARIVELAEAEETIKVLGCSVGSFGTCCGFRSRSHCRPCYQSDCQWRMRSK